MNSSNPRITQQDVADKAGVSRGIVSYVINNGPRQVAPETRERVLQAIAELGYRPNVHAQQLLRKQWGTVAGKDLGLILPNVALLRRPYYGSVLSGIHQAAHDNHHRIRFMHFFAELHDPVRFNALIHREEISGLILMSLDQCIHTAADKKLIEQIRERIDNIVCLEWYAEGLPSVSFDRAGAAYLAAQHLIQLGYRSIIYLGIEDERVNGYLRACMENQLPVNPTSVFFARNSETGYQEVERLISAGIIPRAIVAGSDEVAFGILRCLRQHQITVPHEIAIASIDNIPLAAYAAPPLTTVDVPKIDMGRVAVKVVIKNGKDKDSTTVANLLPTKLIVRESSGA
ncbi:MAG: LacI family DNA-binding transcriptional regulator [Anaerolineales bacterium]|nr:LacI family DNA-binding transcriptional regulator [Anaerolineales bacterium]